MRSQRVERSGLPNRGAEGSSLNSGKTERNILDRLLPVLLFTPPPSDQNQQIWTEHIVHFLTFLRLFFFFAFGICCYLFPSLSRYNRVFQQPAKPEEESFKFRRKLLTRPLPCCKSSRQRRTGLEVCRRLPTD